MGIGSLTTRECDERILLALQVYGPMTVEEIGYCVGLHNTTSKYERQRSIDRLSARGLICSREETIPDPAWPLLRSISHIVFEVVSPEGGRRSAQH